MGLPRRGFRVDLEPSQALRGGPDAPGVLVGMLREADRLGPS